MLRVRLDTTGSGRDVQVSHKLNGISSFAWGGCKSH